MKDIIIRKFGWTVISCLIFFFLFDYFTNALGLSYFQAGHWQCFNVYMLQNYYEEEPDVLFMGSSSIAMAVYPTVVENEIRDRTGEKVIAYNIGQFGGNPAIDKSILQDILTWSRRHPRLIVLGVDIHRFNKKGFEKTTYYKYYASQAEILGSPKDMFVSGYASDMIAGFLRGTSNFLFWTKTKLFASNVSQKMNQLAPDKGSVAGKEELSSWTRAEKKRALEDWNELLKEAAKK